MRRGREDCLAVPSSCLRLLCGASDLGLGRFHAGVATYLLYLDESGTHGGSPCFILAGIAIAEGDAWHLQNRLTDTLGRALPAGNDPNHFELHAAEIKSPSNLRRPSRWQTIPVNTRFRVLHRTYESLASFRPSDPDYPVSLFGAVVDRRLPNYTARAYEEVLHKFDEMLRRRGGQLGQRLTGLAIHDRHAIERDLQRAAETWRHIAGRMGTLHHLADVPLFADSDASRLIQAADFVTWALWRCYGLPQSDRRWIDRLWGMFDADGGTMHGLIHASREFVQGCGCPPCASRRPAPNTPSP